MKKSLKEEEIGKLQADIVLMQAIIDKQAEGLRLHKEIMESTDKKISIQFKMIEAKDEIIAIVERQKAILEKDNLRLNIAIGIFLLLSFVYCIVRIFTL